MFDDIEDSNALVELAQDAANRHRIPFFLVSQPALPGGKPQLRLTQREEVGYVERFDPQ